ncbi:MAG: hypothetical protein COB02_17790 [Candidatus Cloacimonadota bacterium]|nr:MAG: hypothetical protein COB02_17790 [Candidatus Cloacimonadota bacterium]
MYKILLLLSLIFTSYSQIPDVYLYLDVFEKDGIISFAKDSSNTFYFLTTNNKQLVTYNTVKDDFGSFKLKGFNASQFSDIQVINNKLYLFDQKNYVLIQINLINKQSSSYQIKTESNQEFEDFIILNNKAIFRDYNSGKLYNYSFKSKKISKGRIHQTYLQSKKVQLLLEQQENLNYHFSIVDNIKQAIYLKRNWKYMNGLMGFREVGFFNDNFVFIIKTNLKGRNYNKGCAVMTPTGQISLTNSFLLEDLPFYNIRRAIMHKSNLHWIEFDEDQEKLFLMTHTLKNPKTKTK